MFAKTYAKLLAVCLFFPPNGVYLPAVLVFEVLIPDKRPPLLRDGVCQWRRGMYVAVLVWLVCMLVCIAMKFPDESLFGDL